MVGGRREEKGCVGRKKTKGIMDKFIIKLFFTNIKI